MYAQMPAPKTRHEARVGDGGWEKRKSNSIPIAASQERHFDLALYRRESQKDNAIAPISIELLRFQNIPIFWKLANYHENQPKLVRYVVRGDSHAGKISVTVHDVTRKTRDL